MKHAFTALCWAIIALGLGLACTQKPKPDYDPRMPREWREDYEKPPAPPPSHDFGEGSATELAGGHALPMEASPRFPVVYFDYDSDALRPEFLEPLAAAVRTSRARWVCYVDGHASEEGEAAYNLALGERRASRVALYLEMLGRISTVVTSYGEERPVATLPDEAWRNRRAEVKCR